MLELAEAAVWVPPVEVAGGEVMVALEADVTEAAESEAEALAVASLVGWKKVLEKGSLVAAGVERQSSSRSEVRGYSPGQYFE